MKRLILAVFVLAALAAPLMAAGRKIKLIELERDNFEFDGGYRSLGNEGKNDIESYYLGISYGGMLDQFGYSLYGGYLDYDMDSDVFGCYWGISGFFKHASQDEPNFGLFLLFGMDFGFEFALVEVGDENVTSVISEFGLMLGGGITMPESGFDAYAMLLLDFVAFSLFDGDDMNLETDAFGIGLGLQYAPPDTAIYFGFEALMIRETRITIFFGFKT